MGTHSSILAWKIPWTEEPGGLQSTVYKESDTTERLTTHKRKRVQAVLLKAGDGIPLPEPLQSPW